MFIFKYNSTECRAFFYNTTLLHDFLNVHIIEMKKKTHKKPNIMFFISIIYFSIQNQSNIKG